MVGGAGIAAAADVDRAAVEHGVGNGKKAERGTLIVAQTDVTGNSDTALSPEAADIHRVALTVARVVGDHEGGVRRRTVGEGQAVVDIRATANDDRATIAPNSPDVRNNHH